MAKAIHRDNISITCWLMPDWRVNKEVVEISKMQIYQGIVKVLSILHFRFVFMFLNASDPDYYRLGFVAKHAWLFKRDFRSLDSSLSQDTNSSQEARFAGKAMDQCISDLIGDPRTGAKPCNITDECWRFLLVEITHKGIWQRIKLCTLWSAKSKVNYIT